MKPENLKNNLISYQNGKLFFSRQLERKILFFMTVFMLALGAVFKWI